VRIGVRGVGWRLFIWSLEAKNTLFSLRDVVVHVYAPNMRVGMVLTRRACVLSCLGIVSMNIISPKPCPMPHAPRTVERLTMVSPLIINAVDRLNIKCVVDDLRPFLGNSRAP
jgi:hypothetical protein